KAHRHDGDVPLIVEGGAVESEPVAQAFAAGIGPRHAALVNAHAWRLADKIKLRRRADAQNRPRLDVRLAHTTGTNFRQKFCKTAPRHHSPRNSARAMTICWIWLVPS